MLALAYCVVRILAYCAVHYLAYCVVPYLAYSVEATGAGTPHLAFLAFAAHFATLPPTMSRRWCCLSCKVLPPVAARNYWGGKESPSSAKLQSVRIAIWLVHCNLLAACLRYRLRPRILSCKIHRGQSSEANLLRLLHKHRISTFRPPFAGMHDPAKAAPQISLISQFCDFSF